MIASHVTDEEALAFHADGKPGKFEIKPTKPLTTQRDLSLAYSPGVAVPCLHIAENPDLAYRYTNRGNMVAVISNGTAVLGLGAIGALASKPVMEGKAVLFKRFADVDCIDLEVDTADVDEFIDCVRFLGKSFGGINLEDIRAPDCFIIEQRLRELMDIPVFHDDQHGTAIIAAAGVINALDLTGRDIADTKLVCNGAGAAAIACIELLKTMGMRHENVILCDSRGVVWRGREHGMNQWKSAHAADTSARTLTEAMVGADAFLGLSVKGAVTPEMVAAMTARPIVFAMANPDPEITPDEIRSVRNDAIIATGRSDYPNQVNNVLGFPYIFRGALDVWATTINDEMKIAAARAIAGLARGDVPDEVAAAYGGRKLIYGPDYIIPAPFDPRLIVTVPAAVAQAAMESGVARRPVPDMAAYRQTLRERLDLTAGVLNLILEKVQAAHCRVAFAEGEDERVIRAAVAFRDAGYGDPILIGRADRIVSTAASLGFSDISSIEVHDTRQSECNTAYTEFLYRRLARKGQTQRDCERLVTNDRNVFAACMVENGGVDAMVSGATRAFNATYEEIARVIDPAPGRKVIGVMMILRPGRTLFVADTSIHADLDPETIADIAEETAEFARFFGHEPRVALLSASNFGSAARVGSENMTKAIEVLDRRSVAFEYDGEMSPSVALNLDQMRRLYPFCRLSGVANVLVMPGLHSAHISTRLIQELGAVSVMGPVLVGLSRPVQIVQTGASVNDLVNAAALAAYDALRRRRA